MWIHDDEWAAAGGELILVVGNDSSDKLGRARCWACIAAIERAYRWERGSSLTECWRGCCWCQPEGNSRKCLRKPRYCQWEIWWWCWWRPKSDGSEYLNSPSLSPHSRVDTKHHCRSQARWWGRSLDAIIVSECRSSTSRWWQANLISSASTFSRAGGCWCSDRPVF